jgi:YD repeat-containing protein
VNNAYTRFVYVPSQLKIERYTTIESGLAESPSFQIVDGIGRVIASSNHHPGSTGGFSGQRFFYDIMGRVSKTSNPTETSASGPPSQWVAAGDDAAVGWVYTQQAYDWKGRPLITTNQDGTTKTASYSGCGCAGGEVVTLTDEGTTVDNDPGPAVNNVTKKRQRKIYNDVLGRTVKTEILNWQGGSVYSTAVMAYNARDQVQSIKQYQGTEASGVFQETSMTYDGFGRLKTRKVPEQKADATISGSTDHTTWVYNTDDTVQSVTDARGITATFGYNARHQLISISYPSPQNLPLGIPATSNTTYSYDAAGNRMSMSDAAGNTVTYNYDSLSRLLSETRQFAGLSGNYTLAYEYNLAGQVKTVTDQSAGTTFGYVMDNAGRVSTVTSTGLGASVPLASNARYRASGALKHSTYGNGTEINLVYNNRGLIAQYSLSGVKEFSGAARAEGSDFQYHADGQVKFASDFYGRSFSAISAHDKSYQHDQAGRLQVALSGVEANDYLNNIYSGPFHGPAPYLQSYTHDVWNNLIDREGYYWTEEELLDSQIYDAHNRNNAWSYDADGRLLSMNEPPPDELPFLPAQHTYDAAGRHVKHTQTTSRVMPLPGNPVWTMVSTVDASYDGDGQQSKRAETKQINSQQPTNQTRFFLRSTALGGHVITEYDELGGRQKSYVYAGGALITSSPSGGLAWRFNNPATADGRETDGLGRVTNSSYLDPEGVDTGGTDPANNQGEPPPPDPLPQAGAYAAYLPHSLGGSGRCSVDGMETGCALVDSLMDLGTDDQCLNNDCGSQTVTIVGRNHVGRTVGRSTITVWQGDPGWNGSLDGFYNVVNTSPLSFDPSSAFARAFLRAASRYPSGIFEAGEGAFRRGDMAPNPQKPTQPSIDESGVRQNIANRLTSNCKQYIANLINEAARQNRKNPAVSTNLLDIFDDVQKQGGFHRLQVGTRKKPSYSHVIGTIPGKNATVYLAPLKLYPDMTAAEITQGALSLDSLGAFHELTHLAGSKEYDDIQLSRAARALGGPALPTAKTNENLDYSIYLENELKRNCPP